MSEKLQPKGSSPSGPSIQLDFPACDNPDITVRFNAHFNSDKVRVTLVNKGESVSADGSDPTAEIDKVDLILALRSIIPEPMTESIVMGVFRPDDEDREDGDTEDGVY